MNFLLTGTKRFHRVHRLKTNLSLEAFLRLSLVLLWLRSVFSRCFSDVDPAVSLPAQGSVNVRAESTDPSVMNATQASSTSAASAVGPVSVTTTPAPATHSPVSPFPWC